MTEYQIAIPTYRRPQTLRLKTLALLERTGADPERVTIFLSDWSEHPVYETALEGTAWSGRLRAGRPTISGNRAAILEGYAEDTNLMQLDDDLIGLWRLDAAGQALEAVEDIEKELIVPGFELCRAKGAYLFGVYPIKNAFYMQSAPTFGLSYIVGACYGIRVRHIAEVQVRQCEKGDYERTLRHYAIDGRLVRLNHISVETKYYKEGGGMQEERTETRITEAALALEREWPQWVKTYRRKTTGHMELRLRDPLVAKRKAMLRKMKIRL